MNDGRGVEAPPAGNMRKADGLRGVEAPPAGNMGEADGWLAGRGSPAGWKYGRSRWMGGEAWKPGQLLLSKKQRGDLRARNPALSLE